MIFIPHALSHLFTGEVLPWSENFAISFALHRGKPGKIQNENEISYEGYARALVNRVDGSFARTELGVQNTVRIDFPDVLSGEGFYDYWSVGLSRDALSPVLIYGVVSPSRRFIPGVYPSFLPGDLFIEVANA